MLLETTIYTDKTRSNIEEPQQKFRFGTVSNRILGAETYLTGPKLRSLTGSLSASAVVRIFGPMMAS